MTRAVRGPTRLQRAACLLSFCAALPAAAGTLEITVVDARGAPVTPVAVWATPTHPDVPATADAPAGADVLAAAAAPDVGAATHAAHPDHGARTDHAVHTPHAEMDQENNAFVPHVLVVQAGTSVVFPNNDVVSHHVYSFSEAKTFELGLYKGNAHPPLVFGKPGLVVLGCNIHDGMLGYILVVDTPHYGMTDAAGALALRSLPAGDYTLHVWTPRLKPGDLPDDVTVTVGADDSQTRVYRLEGRLLPDHDRPGSSLTWQRY